VTPPSRSNPLTVYRFDAFNRSTAGKGIIALVADLTGFNTRPALVEEPLFETP
jgi:hypothetical protein